MIKGHTQERKYEVSKQLISEVRRHPVLYDKVAALNSSIFAPNKAWRAIEREMDISRKNCKKRWYGIKCTLLKCWREHRKYYLEDEITWLYPYLKGVKSSSLTDFITKLHVYHEYSKLSPSGKAEAHHNFSVIVTDLWYDMKKKKLMES